MWEYKIKRVFKKFIISYTFHCYQRLPEQTWTLLTPQRVSQHISRHFLIILFMFIKDGMMDLHDLSPKSISLAWESRQLHVQQFCINSLYSHNGKTNILLSSWLNVVHTQQEIEQFITAVSCQMSQRWPQRSSNHSSLNRFQMSKVNLPFF